jgi:hypothetical protein
VPLGARPAGGFSAVAIYRLLQSVAFDPEDVVRLTAAYEDALRVLKLTNRDDPITETVAKKIIEIAKAGERDPIVLRRLALEQLGISPEK